MITVDVVMVDVITGGVLALLPIAGDIGVLKLSISNASPSGRLIVMAALFRTGLVKEAAGLGIDLA